MQSVREHVRMTRSACVDHVIGVCVVVFPWRAGGRELTGWRCKYVELQSTGWVGCLCTWRGASFKMASWTAHGVGRTADEFLSGSALQQAAAQMCPIFLLIGLPSEGAALVCRTGV